MINSEHPDNMALASFAEQPASQHSVRQHILHCADCRKKVDTMTSLQNRLSIVLPSIATDTQTSVDEIDIAAFIDGRTNAALGEQIKQDPASLKAALHYATHDAAMQQALKAESSDTVTSNKPSSLWLHVKRWFSSPIPAWGLASAASVLLGMNLMLNGTLQQASNDDLRIASYQDEARIYFQAEAVPGIGFFHNAQPQHEKDFTGVVIAMRATNRLSARWPTIENAAYYNFRLQLINEGDTQTLSETRVAEPHLEIDFEPQQGKRYEWRLSGQTRNGETFHTQGGFVIHRG